MHSCRHCNSQVEGLLKTCKRPLGRVLYICKDCLADKASRSVSITIGAKSIRVCSTISVAHAVCIQHAIHDYFAERHQISRNILLENPTPFGVQQNMEEDDAVFYTLTGCELLYTIAGHAHVSHINKWNTINVDINC